MPPARCKLPRPPQEVSTLRAAPFEAYLARTGNTICGRHALSVLLRGVEAGALSGKAMHWLSYAQSGRVRDESQSSVSYAAGVLTG